MFRCVIIGSGLVLCSSLAPTVAADSNYASQAKPYLDFIQDHLLRRIEVPGLPPMSALTETERPIQGDVWYWTDDNAKALEAFTPPSAYAKHKALADGLTDFIMSMSSNGLILRRRAEEKLEVVSDDPQNAVVKTGLMVQHGAIASGQFFTSYKFHDNLNADAVNHTGNIVRVTIDGKKYVSDVENSIASAQVVRETDAIAYVIESTVKAGPPPEHSVGRVTYKYKFKRGAPGIDLQITFTAASDINIDQVEVTSAVDQLNAQSGIDPRVRYSRLCAAVDGKPYCKDNISNERTAVFKGPLTLFSLIQKGTAGFSYGIHFKVLDPDKLDAVIAEGQQDGNLNWVYAVYNLGGVSPGQTVSVRETRLLTSGGLYEDYQAYMGLLSDLKLFSGVDLSVSYDYGAEINAVACEYMFAERGQYGADAPKAKLPVMRSWVDQNITAYRKNILKKIDGKYPYVFGRGLAFYALGLDCMYRATAKVHYLDALKEAVDVILTLRHDHEASVPDSLKGGFRCDLTSSFLDCHAASLLALARAAFVIDDSRIYPAISAGLSFIRTGDPEADEAHARVKIDDDTLWVPLNGGSSKPMDGSLWTFKAGLTLRAAKAIELAVQKGALPHDPLLLTDADRIRRAAERQILLAVRGRDEKKEILTSFRSGETNSETQPWVSLGIAPADPEIVEVLPPGQTGPTPSAATAESSETAP